MATAIVHANCIIHLRIGLTGQDYVIITELVQKVNWQTGVVCKRVTD
jgi:uncharacterized protein YciW